MRVPVSMRHVLAASAARALKSAPYGSASRDRWRYVGISIGIVGCALVRTRHVCIRLAYDLKHANGPQTSRVGSANATAFMR
jgi:hypothetical protein